MPKFQARSYQQHPIDNTIDLWAEHPVLLGEMGMGGGKTCVGGAILATALNGGRALWLAHRDTLVEQPKAEFDKFFPELAPVGIVQGRKNSVMSKVVCATYQTLINKRRMDGLLHYGQIDILVVDEGHHFLAKSYQDIWSRLLEVNPNLRTLLLTATPGRGDGRNLRALYKQAFCVSIKELIALGRLAMPVSARLNLPISFRGINTAGKGEERDYVAEAVETILDVRNINEIVYEKWMEVASDRQTLAFLAGVSHTANAAKLFSEKGVEAGVIVGNKKKTGIFTDGQFRQEDRNKVRSMLENKQIRIIMNCMVLTEGVNIPIIGCVIVWRPTRSEGAYKQMAGRGLRPHWSLKDCIIMDVCPTDAHKLVTCDQVFGKPRIERGAINKARENELIVDELPIDDMFGIDVDPDSVLITQLDLLDKSDYAWVWQDGISVAGLGSIYKRGAGNAMHGVIVIDGNSEQEKVCAIKHSIYERIRQANLMVGLPSEFVKQRDMMEQFIDGGFAAFYFVSGNGNKPRVIHAGEQKDVVRIAELYADVMTDRYKSSGFSNKKSDWREYGISEKIREKLSWMGVDVGNGIKSGKASRILFHMLAIEAMGG